MRALPLARSSERRDNRIPQPRELASFGDEPRRHRSSISAISRTWLEPASCREAGALDQLWWRGLGGPRSGRTVRPTLSRTAICGNVAFPRGATVGTDGTTAGGTPQKIAAQLGVIAGDPGSPCRSGQPAQPSESAVEVLAVGVSFDVCMGIGMATAATIWPANPMLKAMSRVSARKRLRMPWLMSAQITPGFTQFKLSPTALTLRTGPSPFMTREAQRRIALTASTCLAS